MITVSFGEPYRGWLPVALCANTFELSLAVSAIPANPLDSLCEALVVVAAGGNAQVLWNLEPAEYWFNFENQAGAIMLTIAKRSSHHLPLNQVCQLPGTAKEVLAPFYLALTRFAAHSYSEAHWPQLAKARLAHLGYLLKKSR
jgi:hypothetical protein